MMCSTIFFFSVCFIFAWCKICNAYDTYQQSYSQPFPQQPYQQQSYQQPYPQSYPYYPGSEAFLEDQDYWRKLGRDEVEMAFRRTVNYNHWAKNVVIMVADGMDQNTVTAARIYKESEKGRLTFERFPHLGMLKTYSANKKVPDSAATGTALFTGIKTNNEVVGVDSRVRYEDCMASLSMHSRITSIMQWAQEAGKNTGFVTNKRITDAIPAALYAHSASRYWECNNVPENSMCKDIARQLVEDEPGINLKVIFGGGRQCMMSNPLYTRYDNLDLFTCQRTDNRNLVEEWFRDKHQKNAKSAFIQTTGELLELDTGRTEYALGLFANSYLPFEPDRNRSMRGMPSLEMMIEPAIKMLKRYRHPGFVLVVHGGLIDKAHHEGNARRAIEETIEFDKAVVKTMDVLWEQGIQDETLVIVTGGHGHTMSINGYPDRNSSILGIAERSKHDDIAYTTLTYATGSSVNYQYNQKDNYVYRSDPLRQDTLGKDYHQQAAILTDRETHGGGDVSVYAYGPMGYMFYGIHEQSYVANVIAYALKIGPYRNSAVNCVPTMFAIFGSTLAMLLRVKI